MQPTFDDVLKSVELNSSNDGAFRGAASWLKSVTLLNCTEQSGPRTCRGHQYSAARLAPEGSRIDDDSEFSKLLDLSADLSVAELQRIRRQIAFAYHPDRLPNTDQKVALHRMQLANATIDGALRQRRLRGLQSSSDCSRTGE